MAARRLRWERALGSRLSALGSRACGGRSLAVSGGCCAVVVALPVARGCERPFRSGGWAGVETGLESVLETGLESGIETVHESFEDEAVVAVLRRRYLLG